MAVRFDHVNVAIRTGVLPALDAVQELPGTILQMWNEIGDSDVKGSEKFASQDAELGAYEAPVNAGDQTFLRSVCNSRVGCLKNNATAGRWPGVRYESAFSMCVPAP
jgi:hypothetical protein